MRLRNVQMMAAYERLKRRWLYKSAAPWRWVFLQGFAFLAAWYCFVLCAPVLFVPVDHLIVFFYCVVYAIWKTSAHLFLVNRDADLSDVSTKSAIRYVVCALCAVLHCFVVYMHSMLLMAVSRMETVGSMAHVVLLYAFLSVAMAELLYTYARVPWRTYPEKLTPLAMPPADSNRKKVNLEDID